MLAGYHFQLKSSSIFFFMKTYLVITLIFPQKLMFWVFKQAHICKSPVAMGERRSSRWSSKWWNTGSYSCRPAHRRLGSIWSLSLRAKQYGKLRLVSSAILEHTNNNTSHSWLGLVIVSNDRRTKENKKNTEYHIMFLWRNKKNLSTF